LEALEASAKIIITNSPKVLGSDSDRHQIRIQVSYYFLFVFRVARMEFFKCSKDEGFSENIHEYLHGSVGSLRPSHRTGFGSTATTGFGGASNNTGSLFGNGSSGFGSSGGT
jgi:hypothetical protein